MKPAIEELNLQPLSRIFKGLGDETRLRIVALLCHGELCVCHIETALGLSQPGASRLLGVLRSAGIVESRRVGTWVYYRLAPQLDELCRTQLKGLRKVFGAQAAVKTELDRIVRSRGPCLPRTR